MTQQFTNNGTGTLSAGITNVATSLTMNGGDGAKFPALAGNDFFYATLYQIVVGVETNWEVVKVTARSTDTLTIVRAQQGTTALAFNTGDPVQLRWTKGDADTSMLSIPVRQTVLAGALNSSGNANLLAAGSGLALNLAATAVAVQLAFAAGFSASGEVDYISQLTADVTGVVSSLPANSTSYISATYVDRGSVTWNKTLAPPQYGYIFDRTKQSVLQFAGSAGATTFLDDFGNTWAAQGGAKVQTNQFKFGTGGLGGGGASNVLNGTDGVKCTGITSFGSGGWAIRAWVYPTALPGAGAAARFFGCEVAVNAGQELMIYNNAGTIRFSYSLSSNGSSSDIVSLAVGTTTPVVNTWYFVELTFDILAGVYRMYVNGVQEQSTTSALKCASFSGGMMIGAENNASAGLVGYIDKPEFLPYCQHPGGTTYTSPAATPDVTAAGYSSDYFSIPQMTMFNVTSASSSAGTDPGMTAVNEVYVGECDTSGAAVTAVRNYAYQGKYIGAYTVPFPAASTRTTVGHNIGTLEVVLAIDGVVRTAIDGYLPGEVVSFGSYNSTYVVSVMPQLVDRNTGAWTTGSAGSLSLNNKTSGNAGSILSSLSTVAWRMRAQRSF